MQNECTTVKQSQTELHSFLVLCLLHRCLHMMLVYLKRETMDMLVHVQEVTVCYVAKM